MNEEVRNEDILPDSALGNCPQCGRAPVMRNYYADHLGCCDPCRVFWHIGTNLFSGWRWELEQNERKAEAGWAANRCLIEDQYREVDPLFAERQVPE